MNNTDTLDLRWHGKLPIDLGQTFDEIAYQIRRDFILLIDQASLNLSNNLDWWIEGPASRNYFSSPLFHYCCSFVLLEKLAIQKKIPKIVIVDSKAFCKILKTWINDNGYNLQVFQRPRIDETLIKFYFGGILRTFKSSFKLFLSFMATRNIRNSNKKINNSQPLILIDTFVLDTSEVKDRYYPGLWENLDPSDKKRTFFVPEFERNTISKIRKTIDILNLSEKKYLFKWEFLRIEDYFYAFNHYFRLKKIQVPPSVFRGVQFKELIQEELFTGLNSGMAMKAILNYRFFQRLKKLDIKIETAINWFENQGLDKGWNCGLHDFFPETKIKGYLGMIISQHYLPMFPTKIEAESNVIPDTLYVIGKGLEESIKEFYPELSVQTAPAFRFQGVYRDSIKKGVNSDQTVLVVLYSVLEDAVKAMKFALETHQILGNEINVRWQIKPHPLTSKEKVLDALAEPIPEDWKWIDIDFHDCLDEVDVLMGSASTTCMEALARNKYVIIIGNQHGITHNPVPFSVTNLLWKLCYSPAEAGEVIMKCVSGVGEISEAVSIRENYFEPLTREGVEKLIS